jgi:hypothetical protein
MNAQPETQQLFESANLVFQAIMAGCAVIAVLISLWTIPKKLSSKLLVMRFCGRILSLGFLVLALSLAAKFSGLATPLGIIAAVLCGFDYVSFKAENSTQDRLAVLDVMLMICLAISIPAYGFISKLTEVVTTMTQVSIKSADNDLKSADNTTKQIEAIRDLYESHRQLMEQFAAHLESNHVPKDAK